MQVEVCHSAEDAGIRAAGIIAGKIQDAVAESGTACIALSGGDTPKTMLRALASRALPWRKVMIFQVDERIVAIDDPRRNLAGLTAAFARVPRWPRTLCAMPVDNESPRAGTARYVDELRAWAGNPPHIDVVHLGLGEDGHTASLFAGGDGLDTGCDVAVTGPYKGTQRMTLTLNAINRSHSRVWLVTGSAKRLVVQRFLDGDAALVASRVSRINATLVLDDAAAGH